MKVFIPLLSSVYAGPKFNLNAVLDNLNDLNDWATSLGGDLGRSDTELPDGLDDFKSDFAHAAEFGATRKEVKELEQRGRRVILDDMVRLVGDGIDISNLSGYGCYGTPIDRLNKNWIGKGKPVDAIDEVNFRLTNCYKCLKIDHPNEICDGTVPYRVTNRSNGIMCRNEEGTCKRSTCECDKAYVFELAAILSEYNPDNHIDNGFDREIRCKIRAPRGLKDDKDNNGNGKSPTQCCGSGLQRMVFKVDRFECCADGSVKPFGQC